MRTSPRYFVPFVLGLAWAGCISASNSGGGGGGDATSDGADVIMADGATTDGADASTDGSDATQADASGDATSTDAATDAATDTASDASTDAATDSTPDGPAPDAPSDSTAADATTDVTADASADATTDVAADTTPDTTPDVAADVALDVASDATPEAAVDVATDTTGATDATPDASVDASSDASADAATCTPATETCNGRDDDCDGVIDESSCGTHLLITEVVVGPTEAEFIEIHNPTAAAIDLSNYYLSDFHDYACLLGRTCAITGRTAPTSIATSDFVARFPAGATLAPGGYLVVTTTSPERFATIAGGRCPTYYLPASGLAGDGGAVPLGPCTGAVAMRGAPTTANTVGSSAGLTNGGELAILFRWDGTSNLVEDVDYTFWGAASSSNLQVDKSGTSAMGSPYRTDTPAAMQQRVAAPDNGAAAIRCNYAETGERTSGGNGLGGHDETSEPLMTTWRTTVAPVVPDGGMLTSITATPGTVNDCR